MDDPQLQAQLESFAPEYQEFVTGPVPEMMANAYGKPLELTDKELTVLENGFILYLLAMLSKNEWVDFISVHTSLNNEIAQSVVDEMMGFASPELQTELEKIRTQDIESDETMLSPQSTDRQTSNTVPKRVVPQTEKPVPQKQTDPTLVTKQREDLLKEIEEAEEKLASISPIRTMQTDYQQTKEGGEPAKAEVEKEEVVETEQSTEPVSPSSSQDELLNKKKSQYADLRPQDSSDLKWDSDNS